MVHDRNHWRELVNSLRSFYISQAKNQREASIKQKFMQVSCLALSSALKMEAKCSSETSVDFQTTTRRYIPEDSTLHFP
jgi:hypothetical protein